MEVCTNLPGSLCTNSMEIPAASLNVVCWDKFLRITRFDDDTDWHEQFLSRTYSEDEFFRKRKENVKKRSKSDTTTHRLPPQANSEKSSNITASSEKRSERMEKKFVRQNSTSYRHSLPGIVENGVYNEQEAADRRSYTVDNVTEMDKGTNLDKKSASMSDLRNQGKETVRYRTETPHKDGISQRVSNVKRMLRLNGLMHAE
ncbi:hypothetical protein ACHWQZ_G007190 [Mnemiopsis leidyi]